MCSIRNEENNRLKGVKTMSKNYNNYNYGNREQRRQQERQARKENNIQEKLNSFSVVRNNNIVSSKIEQEDDELVYYMDYKGESYEINGGYLTVLNIMAIEEEKAEKKSKGQYSVSKDVRLALSNGEYERFFENNPKISINEIANVATAITKLIMTDGNEIEDEAAEEQDSFRS